MNLKFAMSLMILLPTMAIAKPHWVLVPFFGEEEQPFYYDKNSVIYDQEQNKVFMTFKNNFGTPPNRLEKTKGIIKLEYDCQSNTGLLHGSMYVVGIRLPIATNTETIAKDDRSFDLYSKVLDYCP